MQVQPRRRRALPVVDIYRDLEAGNYYVQPYTEGPVGTTAFGAPTLVAAEHFTVKIVDAVLENLKKFGKEKFDPSRAIRRAQPEQRKFLARHLGVGVRETLSGGLIVRPLHHERGGFIGLNEDAITLSAEEIPGKLAEAVAEAFKRAT